MHTTDLQASLTAKERHPSSIAFGALLLIAVTFTLLSLLALLARIVSQAGSFTITSQGVPGSVYRFQYTTSSSAPYVWTEFSPPAVFTAPNNGVFQYVDANPPGPLRLYRVISNR